MTRTIDRAGAKAAVERLEVEGIEVRQVSLSGCGTNKQKQI